MFSIEVNRKALFFYDEGLTERRTYHEECTYVCECELPFKSNSNSGKSFAKVNRFEYACTHACAHAHAHTHTHIHTHTL